MHIADLLRHTRPVLWCLVLACSAGLLIAVGCADYSKDPNARVADYAGGQLESDLIRQVGPPSSSRTTRDSPEQSPCRAGSFGIEAQRELTYDIPSRGFDKRLRDLLRMKPSQSFVVCVDSEGKIIRVVTVQVH